MVAEIARAVNDFRPLGENLERICERVTELSGYDATALFMPDRVGRRLGAPRRLGPQDSLCRLHQPARI
jgi:hypothetical protein